MNYKKILIIKLSAIGDVIHALPVSRALKECYPNATITWIVEKPAYDLLTNNPDVDDIILFEKPKFKSIKGAITHGPGLIKMLRSQRFDLVLDLQGLFKSAALAYAADAPQRLGYCNMREISNVVSKPVVGSNAQGHVVERYLDVVRFLGCKVTKPDFVINVTGEEAASAYQKAEREGFNLNSQYIVLAPGTNWATKCWPTRHFGALADCVGQEGLIPVLIGGANERSLADSIRQFSSLPVVDLVGQTTLKELAHIIRGAKAYVGGDTGTMHLAAAVNTPVVAMFGPTDPVRNGPYSEIATTITALRECRGCWKRSCPRKLECLDVINPETVLQAIKKLLA